MNPLSGETKNPLTNCRVIGSGIDVSVYLRRDESIERGNLAYVMSNSELREVATNPARWLAGMANDETKQTEWGTLVDALALDGAGFEKRFAIAPATYPAKESAKKDAAMIEKPWNWNANYCGEWRDGQERAGKIVVKNADFEAGKQAAEALLEDPRISTLIQDSDKQVMVTGEYHDRETKLTIPLRGLIDIVPTLESTYSKSLGDLKTCTFAAPNAWPKVVFERGYHTQAALYLDLYTAATGEDRIDFVHVLQESFSPYAVGRRVLSAEFIELGRVQYISALQRYCACLKADVWPGYDDGAPLNGWTLVHPVAWMLAVENPPMIFSTDRQPQADNYETITP